MTTALALTGIGLVTPLGTTSDGIFRRLLQGDAAIPSAQSPAGDELPRWAEVPALPPLDRFGGGCSFLNRYIHLSLASIWPALDHAGIRIPEEGSDRIGVVHGGAVPEIGSIREFIEMYEFEGPMSVSPMAFANSALNAAAGQCGIRLKLRTVNATVSAGWLSGLTALEFAWQQIENETADVVLVNAVQETNPVVVAMHAGNRLLKESSGNSPWCLPYDAKRRGAVLGTASSTLVVESMEHAAARGARPLAEISRPCMHVISELHSAYTDGCESDLRDTFLAALVEAAVGPAEVDYVSGAGNGSAGMDHLEACALQKLVRERTAVGSIKGALGELGAASSLVQIAMAALAFAAHAVPPTLGYECADPDVDLPGLSGRVQRGSFGTALVSALCPSGNGGALVVKKPTR